eukprot:m51a1_g465 hypothetical protein (322) ;mRNA; r:176023-177647
MTDFKGGEADVNRIRMMEKQRLEQQRDFEERKATMESQVEKAAILPIDQKFSRRSTAVDEEFTRQTTGLVTVEQFRNKRRLIDDLHEKAEAALKQEQEEEEQRRKRQKKQQQTTKLSFEDDEECDAAAPPAEEIKPKKNPFVDTSFLPDRERELQATQMREKLAKEWLERQELIKKEEIEVTYSFWDGSGHRRSLSCTKGTTIAQFLDKVRSEFKELRSVSVDQLLYVKEDLIIPHIYSFYDLIESKARGKSGPLFHFDVHDDIRLENNAAIEKDESHAAKVVERRWYEHNKHIFPASRWEVFDPSVERGTYTIKDTKSKH